MPPLTEIPPPVVKVLAEKTDDDGLTTGLLFADMDQENVRIGDVWVGIDDRLPWRLGEYLRARRELWSALRLRLDLRRFETTDGHASPLRKAYWWGPRFDWSEIDSRDRGSSTVYADPTKTLHALGRVEMSRFDWDFPKDERIGILQIHEFANSPNKAASDGRTALYLHSIRDRDAKHFVHADGAVKTFTDEAYQVAYAGGGTKASRYEKLFRLDGQIDNSVWFPLVACFFSGNPLIQEYFHGE
jgi:hypothetical protein